MVVLEKVNKIILLNPDKVGILPKTIVKDFTEVTTRTNVPKKTNKMTRTEYYVSRIREGAVLALTSLALLSYGCSSNEPDYGPGPRARLEANKRGNDDNQKTNFRREWFNRTGDKRGS
jgi:hypothetical protein